MKKNEWERILIVLAGMRAVVGMIHNSLDPESEEEEWLRRQLGEVHDLLTLCISHCHWNAKRE